MATATTTKRVKKSSAITAAASPFYDDDVWSMFCVVEDFYNDNYLPPDALQFGAFAKWVSRSTDDGRRTTYGVPIDDLHRKLSNYSVYGQKSLSHLIHFVTKSLLIHERTRRR